MPYYGRTPGMVVQIDDGDVVADVRREGPLDVRLRILPVECQRQDALPAGQSAKAGLSHGANSVTLVRRRFVPPGTASAH
jgi:hypothetical protein